MDSIALWLRGILWCHGPTPSTSFEIVLASMLNSAFVCIGSIQWKSQKLRQEPSRKSNVHDPTGECDVPTSNDVLYVLTKYGNVFPHFNWLYGWGFAPSASFSTLSVMQIHPALSSSKVKWIKLLVIDEIHTSVDCVASFYSAKLWMCDLLYYIPLQALCFVTEFCCTLICCIAHSCCPLDLWVQSFLEIFGGQLQKACRWDTQAAKQSLFLTTLAHYNYELQVGHGFPPPFGPHSSLHTGYAMFMAVQGIIYII